MRVLQVVVCVDCSSSRRELAVRRVRHFARNRQGPSGALIPQRRNLKSAVSEREQNTRTDAKGEFMINAIRLGIYPSSGAPGFATLAGRFRSSLAAPNVE